MTEKKEQKELTPFEKLFSLDVNDKTEKKNNGKVDLTYLSWSWAWAEFKKVYPDALYEIKHFPDTNGLMRPYMEDVDFGIMVWTSVTAGGQTYEMWLPVMDGANRSLKRTPYNIKVKSFDYKEKKMVETTKEVAAANMFDINKTIMRCLVKNFAMFGLGLYIYSGEDLPEDLTSEKQSETQKTESKVEVRKEPAPEKHDAPKAKIETDEELLARKNYETNRFYAIELGKDIKIALDKKESPQANIIKEAKNIIPKLNTTKDKVLIDKLKNMLDNELCKV